MTSLFYNGAVIKISTPAWHSRFTRPVFLWAICALLTEMAVQSLGKTTWSIPSWLTLLPVMPAVFFVVALFRAVQRMDELQKRICLESVFLAFLVTLVLAFLLAALDRAGIYHAKFDALGTPMMGLWALAYVVSVWRYR
jgi:O-antigen/teichoic acid export membrane protein